ncbi:MAG: hypothetical protein CL605_06285 [Altibacter sp.]|nr:hypothetical protein [Altibacter sp.]
MLATFYILITKHPSHVWIRNIVTSNKFKGEETKYSKISIVFFRMLLFIATGSGCDRRGEQLTFVTSNGAV